MIRRKTPALALPNQLVTAKIEFDHRGQSLSRKKEEKRAVPARTRRTDRVRVLGDRAGLRVAARARDRTLEVGADSNKQRSSMKLEMVRAVPGDALPFLTLSLRLGWAVRTRDACRPVVVGRF